MHFPRLFQPGSIGSLAVANRVIMPAMATNFASSTGEPTDRLIAYYGARARGGVGLVIVENTTVEHRLGSNGAVQLRIDDDRYIPGLHHLAEAIRTEGTPVAVQINHAGSVARTPMQPLAPSRVAWSEGGAEPHALSAEEIEGIVALFARAAVRAKRAGFDAVEIHGAHGYLIGQFLSPLVNRRTDRYGGSSENRWRFAFDVVGAIRDAVGPGYPLLFRVSGDEYLPGGRTIDETRDLAPAVVEAGIDAIHVSAATPVNPERQLEPMAYPEGWRIDLAEAVKRAVEVPVIGVGVIRTPETAERLLAEEKADFVAVGRGLIADPEWPRKAASGEARAIRRCISCNRCVRHRVFDDLAIRCSVNPRVGREAERIPPAEERKHVVVVGGGPAGLSASTTAAERGHRVTLFDAAVELGGRLRLAAVPPHKEKIGWLIEDLSFVLPETVDVHLGACTTAKQLIDMEPDVVLLATGSTPTCLGVPGADRPHVHLADAVLSGRAEVTGRVVVIGGGMVGCETASFCAEQGSEVTVVEALDDVASDCEPITRGELASRLVEEGVTVRTGVTVLEITPLGIRIESKGREELVAAESVVCAIGSGPDCRLSEELAEATFPVRVIGDAREARGICEAIHEGWRAAVTLAGVRDGVEGR
jgi:2,4-dienoyl-CoA reductase-like NADH-dependent reductase (Old Yellow Enzyme family)/thioredoxin reductase